METSGSLMVVAGGLEARAGSRGFLLGGPETLQSSLIETSCLCPRFHRPRELTYLAPLLAAAVQLGTVVAVAWVRVVRQHHTG